MVWEGGKKRQKKGGKKNQEGFGKGKKGVMEKRNAPDGEVAGYRGAILQPITEKCTG